MFDFLRRRARNLWSMGPTKRAAHEELFKLETEYQLRINELNRKVEKQQQRQQEILEKGKRESSELVRLGLAEQYARGERQIRRLLDRRKMLVKAQEIVEVQLANFDLQDAIPEEILNLNRPEAQRARAMADMVRDQLDQTYDDILAGFEDSTNEHASDNRESSTIQAVLEMFDRERDEEIHWALRAIEEDLDTRVSESHFANAELRAGALE